MLLDGGFVVRGFVVFLAHSGGIVAFNRGGFFVLNRLLLFIMVSSVTVFLSSRLVVPGLWFVVFLNGSRLAMCGLVAMILSWFLIVIEVGWHGLMLLTFLILDAVAEP